jgi:hypothetical protein
LRRGVRTIRVVIILSLVITAGHKVCLRSPIFGCVASKGLAVGAFCMCGREGTYRTIFPSQLRSARCAAEKGVRKRLNVRRQEDRRWRSAPRSQAPSPPPVEVGFQKSSHYG